MKLFLSAALSALLVLPVALPAQAPESQAPAPPAATSPVATQEAPGQNAPPAGAGAQPTKSADGTYTIRRNARLVVLDVVVLDSKNNIVPNLTKDDFHVTELGEPQTIQNFEVASRRIPPADVDIESTADLDRLAPRAPVNIILLDEFNTRFEDEAFARYSLKKFLEKQPDKLAVPTMLIAVDLQKFSVLRDYTENKAELISALDHHFAAFPWQAQNYSWLAERYGTAFQTLTRVAQATVGHVGHKNMIWIGRGFPAINFTSSANLDAASRVDSYVQECVNTLRDARITLYTIDPAGLQVNNTYGSAAEFNDPFGGNFQFAALARATGGRAIYGRNDVDAQIGDAVRDGENFYTLTYRPTGDSEDRAKFRKIKITFDKPGLTAVTRQGYYLQRRPRAVDPTNPSRRLVADLVSAQNSTMVYDGVPLTVTPGADDPNHYMIHVDARSLAWTAATDEKARQTSVILLVTQFDKKGKELKQDGKNITVSAPRTVDPTGRLERAIDMGYKLEPEPKAVRARFVVRVAASGRLGTADVNLGDHTVVSSTSSREPAPATP